MELFASRGYQATTVGDIEAAAGFTARGGTLYKHFPSKQALLEAAVDQQVDEVRQGRAIADLLPLGDLRAETVLVFRYLFAELTRYRTITALIEKEGASTDPLSERFWDQIVEPGYRLTAQILDHQLNKDGHANWDTEALAVLLVGAAVNIRRAEWTFGQLALNVEEERLISTIASIVEALAGARTGESAD